MKTIDVSSPGQVRYDGMRHGADWTFSDGLVFRSGREATKVGGCDADAKDCVWPAGQSPQRFDGKHYLEADGKLADFDYLQPFTMAAWIEPESPNVASNGARSPPRRLGSNSPY